MVCGVPAGRASLRLGALSGPLKRVPAGAGRRRAAAKGDERAGSAGTPARGVSVGAVGGRRDPRSGRRRRLYRAAALSVLLLAAALRFHDLSGDSLWYDEAVAALNAQGSFTEAVERTRAYNTSPILYPLALWVVQKVKVSNFSVRLLPAVGSTAAVAVLLFLLPGAGAGRRTALFAGALAAVSAAAIAEAHGVREYSLDALVAALLLVGLLRHLGGGGRVLLPLALFLGPFLQYGLVLFGGAVLAAAFVVGGGSGAAGPGMVPSRLRAALRGRHRLAPAAAAFAAGCAGSYFTTLRGQLDRISLSMGYLSHGYYPGDPSDVAAALRFAGSKAWETLAHHLTAPFTSATALAAALLAAFTLARRRAPAPTEAADRPRRLAERVVPALLAVSLLIAVAAALAGAYPLGSLRHGTYLGPVVFSATAVVWGRLADLAAARARRRSLSGWLAAAALAGGVGAGAAEVAGTTPFGAGGNVEEILAELTRRGREGDLIYASGVATPPVEFYAGRRPEGMVFGSHGCYAGFADCAREALAIARSRIPAPDRLWVVHSGAGDRVELLPDSPRARTPALWMERVVSGTEDLYLAPNLGEVVLAENRSRFAEYESAFHERAEEPTVRSRFDLHHREDALFYRRAPCSAADLEARFFLRFHATDSSGRRTVNRDFDFPEYGVLAGEACTAMVPLPPGEFNSVTTGQFPGGKAPRWEARWRLDLASYRTAFEEIASRGAGPPAVRSAFDLYLRRGSLLYYRAPCAPEDLGARFFLRLYPFPDRNPDPVGGNGFDLRYFDFDEYGIVEDGKCLAIVPLPTEGYSRFETGQWSEAASWRAAAVLDRSRHRAALRSWGLGEWGEPAARGHFELHLVGGELRYVREPCAARDVEERFFLHLQGSAFEAGPGSSGQPASENRDFDFPEYGALLDGRCLAMVPLPATDLHRISTGQFTSGAPPTWQADLWPGRRRLEARLESVVSGRLGPPAARSAFDLYIDETEVLFYRASCSTGDVEAKFFLHFYPEEEAALPTGRRRYGFLNLDFEFAASGFLRDGRCLASARLPESAGGRLRAGQFLPGGERVWSAEADVPPFR